MTNEDRKKIAYILRFWLPEQSYGYNEAIGDIEKYLNRAGYVKLADDQSLPENPTPISTRYDDPRYMDRLAHDEYEKAQQNMLKAGWRKVELNGNNRHSRKGNTV